MSEGLNTLAKGNRMIYDGTNTLYAYGQDYSVLLGMPVGSVGLPLVSLGTDEEGGLRLVSFTDANHIKIAVADAQVPNGEAVSEAVCIGGRDGSSNMIMVGAGTEGGTFTQQGIAVGGIDASSKFKLLDFDNNGYLNINIQDGTTKVKDSNSDELGVNADGSINIVQTSGNLTQLGGNTIDLGSGAAGSATQRMILCTDDPAVTALQIMDDWDEVHDSAVGSDGALIMAEARNSLGTAVANGDASRFITDLYGRMVPANFTFATQSCRVEEIDPLSEKYIGETLADVTDGADDTYYYYVDMSGYTTLSAQLILSGGSGTCTVTVEGTVQDDGTAPASCTYIDVSNDLYGAASWTASDMLYDTNRIGGQFKYLRFKVVAATGDADDADWTIFSKKMWC